MKKSSKIIIAIVAVVILLVMIFVSNYNGLVASSEEVTNKYATIDTYLQRRADLIPNLVNTVKGYTQHEQKIVDSITQARAEMVGAKDIAGKAEANEKLTSALNSLMVVVENYPDLKASSNFNQLADELAGTENRIAVARKDYNDAVKRYNLKIKRIPTSIFANMLGYESAQYFQASETSKEVPNVEF